MKRCIWEAGMIGFVIGIGFATTATLSISFPIYPLLLLLLIGASLWIKPGYLAHLVLILVIGAVLGMSVVSIHIIHQEPSQIATYQGYSNARPDNVKEGTSPTIQPSQTRLSNTDTSQNFSDIATNIRNSLVKQINTIFPVSTSGIIAGILIGYKDDIPKDITNAFRISGLSHILVISGYNITILLFVCGSLLIFLRPVPKLIVLTLLTVFFVMIVGGGSAVIRAALMGLIGYTIHTYGRKGYGLRVLLMSLCVMLIYDPRYLLSDVGFELSFLAVLGLMYVSPAINSLLTRIPDAYGIKEAFSYTLSAQIMTFPLIAIIFHTLSIISPLSNMLVFFTPPIIMFGGFITLLTSWIPYVSIIPAFITHMATSYLVYIAEASASWPLSSVTLPYFPLQFLIVSYLTLGVLLLLWYRRRHKVNVSTVN